MEACQSKVNQFELIDPKSGSPGLILVLGRSRDMVLIAISDTVIKEVQ